MNVIVYTKMYASDLIAQRLGRIASYKTATPSNCGKLLRIFTTAMHREVAIAPQGNLVKSFKIESVLNEGIVKT